ncbi:serine--tRNA ligase [Candidatus Woesearchaeota archaeon]|nr:serine--tRNA ligase [Candidatus Woesearchaeota archaeon]
MLEKRFIIENPAVVKKDLEKRGQKEKLKWVDDIVALDEKWKKLKSEIDSLRASRNKLSLEINKLKKEKKDSSKILKEASELPKKISEKESEMKKIDDKILYYRMRIPNILHDSVPVGKDDSENVEVKKVGTIKKFDFKLKSHGELAEELGIADFKRAAKTAGAGFVYVKGPLALLDLALQRFAIDFLIKKGFTLIEPPLMMNKKAYEGVTDLADFENVMYKIENDDLYMIATSEHPMVSMYMDEVLGEKELPIKLVGVSPCFRREIGSHGVDTKGFYRMHQFNKVEQVIICKPEDSWKFHEEIQKNSEEIFKSIGIPFRVVNVCTGDMGIVAAKKYDMEAWFPREQKYGEITSASNCTSYQAVRLNIKYLKGAEKTYVHTLNNTGLATSRAIRAILENFQNKDSSVTVPDVLIPYMNGMKVIKK